MTAVKAPFLKQQGMLLLEALVAILIFSVGILGLMGLQAASIKTVGDAKYRADASFLTDQIIGRMWADRANLSCYVRPASTALCTSEASKANLADWLANVSSLLPGATAELQQISVNADNQVVVTVVWRGAQDAQTHKFVAAAHING